MPCHCSISASSQCSTIRLDSPILTISATPTISSNLETQIAGHTVSIAESTSGAALYYTMDGITPSPASLPYGRPITLTSSTAINAVAVLNSLRNSVASNSLKVIVPLSVALTPLHVTLSPPQAQAFTAAVAGSSNSAITLSLNPPLGSISAAGLDTAPALINSAQTVTVIATSVADSTKTASAGVSLVPPVTKQTVLSVSAPSTLSFTATQGSSATSSQTVLIQNTSRGNSTLRWSATSTEPWLTFSALSGSLAGGTRKSVTLLINPTGLGLGIFNATATFTDPNASNSPQTLPVTLTVHSIISGYPVLNVERTFPSDTGMINVKTEYGAKGDGVTDDTAAIQKAISSVIRGRRGSILYFPSGTYIVSSPLVEKDLSGTWQSVLTFQGENGEHSIIKLTDNNPAYQSSGNPADVLDMGSLEPINPHNGGGNNGFDNYIFDMTIDIGKGNPGAVALDYMGNNFCGLRNVTLKSSDPNHAGAIGLSMLRYATGPCLMKNVVISGFDYGIDTANLEYSATFEGLTLLNQNLYGIYNASNVLSIRGLVSTNKVPAIYNQSPNGLVTLLQASLQGGSSGVSAIVNNGTLYARTVTATGYYTVLRNNRSTPLGSRITEYDSGPVHGLFPHPPSSMNLPIEETPQFEDTNLANWANVVSFGADPTGTSDGSAAIQAAIDSGATTVYFPMGKYAVSHTINIHGNVRMIDGFDSTIQPSGSVFQNTNRPTPLFQVNVGTSSVTLNHLNMGNFQDPYPGIVFVEQNSSRPLALLNSYYNGASVTAAYQNTSKGTGPLFVEDAASLGPWQILFPQSVFARQLDPETNATKIVNEGGTLWILGLKTERTGTNIKTERGGSTELLGGLIYPVQNVPRDQSTFIINNSRASLIYAVSNYTTPGASPYPDFNIQVTETRDGVIKALSTASLPTRGYGVMMPLYSDQKSIK